MVRWGVILWAGLLGFSGLLWAGGGETEFHLQDGSVIRGELVALEGGTMVVRSPTLGEVRIPTEALRSMGGAAEGGAGPAGAEGVTMDHFAAIRRQTESRVASDPALQRQMDALAQDPELTALMADPDFMQLILSGDFVRMQGDPRVQRLMNHPGLQGLVNTLAPQQ